MLKLPVPPRNLPVFWQQQQVMAALDSRVAQQSCMHELLVEIPRVELDTTVFQAGVQAYTPIANTNIGNNSFIYNLYGRQVIIQLGHFEFRNIINQFRKNLMEEMYEGTVGLTSYIPLQLQLLQIQKQRRERDTEIINRHYQKRLQIYKENYGGQQSIALKPITAVREPVNMPIQKVSEYVKENFKAVQNTVCEIVTKATQEQKNMIKMQISVLKEEIEKLKRNQSNLSETDASQLRDRSIDSEEPVKTQQSQPASRIKNQPAQANLLDEIYKLTKSQNASSHPLLQWLVNNVQQQQPTKPKPSKKLEPATAAGESSKPKKKKERKSEVSIAVGQSTNRNRESVRPKKNSQALIEDPNAKPPRPSSATGAKGRASQAQKPPSKGNIQKPASKGNIQPSAGKSKGKTQPRPSGAAKPPSSRNVGGKDESKDKKDKKQKKNKDRPSTAKNVPSTRSIAGKK